MQEPETHKRVWVSKVSREKSVRRLPFCEVPQSPAHRLDYNSAQGKSANMAAFSKVQSLFLDPLPQAEKEGHKVCFYVARGKLAIEIIS